MLAEGAVNPTQGRQTGLNEDLDDDEGSDLEGALREAGTGILLSQLSTAGAKETA